MRLQSCRKIGRIEDAAYCPHYYLKVVEVVGYRASSGVKQLMYLIKNAVALEKIIIDPVRHWHWGNMDRRSDEVEEEVKARDHAMQELKGMVPSTIEFVCQ